MKPMNLAPALLAALLASGAAHAMTDDRLAGLVGERLHGDRTGACFAAAVVDSGNVSRAYVCADPADDGRIGPDSAFEIGSVSKTMTAALLAGLIAGGQGSLEDPLADWLPEGTAVPAIEGEPIRLRHVVTHTSGLPALPPGVPIPNPADPYAAMEPDDLLEALGRISLPRAPGTQFEYSNYASMLLSYAVARRTGVDFEHLLDERLFSPLGMDHAYVNDRPGGVRVATGHLPNGQPAPPWNFHTDLAGVGGVHATLGDMVAYVQGHLGAGAAPVHAALEMTRQPVAHGGGPVTGMNWMLAPLNGRTIHAHEGGTGGFSSFVGFDREQGRAVVVLSDTALHSVGGLGSLALHLLDDSVPLGGPRTVATPPAELLQALEGTWQLQGMMQMQLRRSGDGLEIEPAGQPVFQMGYDSAGDFYPLQFDAVLRPQRHADGSYTFTWHQGGGAVPASRVANDGASPPATALPAEVLQAYVGTYTLMPGFELAITAGDGQLYGQATGQGRFGLQAAGADVFRAPAFGIEIRFERRNGELEALSLHQAGQVLRGTRN